MTRRTREAEREERGQRRQARIAEFEIAPTAHAGPPRQGKRRRRERERERLPRTRAASTRARPPFDVRRCEDDDDDNSVWDDLRVRAGRRSSFVVCRLSFVVRRVSCVVCRLSFVVRRASCRPSSSEGRMSFVALVVRRRGATLARSSGDVSSAPRQPVAMPAATRAPRPLASPPLCASSACLSGEKRPSRRPYERRRSRVRYDDAHFERWFQRPGPSTPSRRHTHTRVGCNGRAGSRLPTPRRTTAC